MKKVKNKIRKAKVLGMATLLTLTLSLSKATAQTMYVNESSGTQTAYLLSNIQKMTFSSQSFTITKANNNQLEYTLSAIQYLNFTDDLTSIKKQKVTEILSINAYPNPVKSTLTVEFRSMSNLNGTISILSIEGKLIKKLPVVGSDIITFDMSHLSHGIYLCRYNNGTEIKTVKIIKH
ncbi:MAG: T9SS type A sorting domain-containing protein [Bacteroidales bacterium]